MEDPIPAGFITLPEALQRIADCVSEAHVESARLDFQAHVDAIAKALVEKETLYYRDLVAILEPHRTKEDVDREISEMSERKLVGKPAVIDLNMISGLKGIAAGTKKKSARDTNGNGKNGHGVEVDADGNEIKVIKADDKKDEESKN